MVADDVLVVGVLRNLSHDSFFSVFYGLAALALEEVEVIGAVVAGGRDFEGQGTDLGGNDEEVKALEQDLLEVMGGFELEETGQGTGGRDVEAVIVQVEEGGTDTLVVFYVELDARLDGMLDREELFHQETGGIQLVGGVQVLPQHVGERHQDARHLHLGQQPEVAQAGGRGGFVVQEVVEGGMRLDTLGRERQCLSQESVHQLVVELAVVDEEVLAVLHHAGQQNALALEFLQVQVAVPGVLEDARDPVPVLLYHVQDTVYVLFLLDQFLRVVHQQVVSVAPDDTLVLFLPRFLPGRSQQHVLLQIPQEVDTLQQPGSLVFVTELVQ